MPSHRSAMMDVDATGWQKDVVLSNVRDNRLIMTYANSGYKPFLQNYIVGLRALSGSGIATAWLATWSGSAIPSIEWQAGAASFDTRGRLERERR